jgi:hypothetical protein
MGVNRLATRVKKTKTFSKGCAVQALALLLPFIGAIGGRAGSVIGTVLMVVFVFVGWKMSTTWFCGACGKPIANRKVKVCPSCQAKFK